MDPADMEGDGDGGTWLRLFLDEEESMLDDREGVRVRETITRSETVRQQEQQTRYERVVQVTEGRDGVEEGVVRRAENLRRTRFGPQRIRRVETNVAGYPGVYATS